MSRGGLEQHDVSPCTHDICKIFRFPRLTVKGFSYNCEGETTFHEYQRQKWSGLRTLIVVHSSPSQGDFRTVIRETWGGREAYEAVRVRPLFFLGRSTDPEGEKGEVNFRALNFIQNGATYNLMSTEPRKKRDVSPSSGV